MLEDLCTPINLSYDTLVFSVDKLQQHWEQLYKEPVDLLPKLFPELVLITNFEETLKNVYREHGTKANYYYRLRRVREACLETIQGKMPAQQVVPVQPRLLQQQEQKGSNVQAGLDISTKGFSVHVTEFTPMPLLAAVLEVIRDAE